MNRSLKLGALAAFGIASFVPALAQVPGDASTGTVTTRDIRVLTPEVSRSLRIARNPSSPAAMLIGTYWSCYTHSSGFDICKLKLVVCTNDQSLCVEV